ncbi:MAG: heme-binding protein [Pseudomonadales bacterium]|nr:heme-binding protein [Pseudomonadales bacterium]MCP5215717.1 heme-binding protein [Pseudomonadales bacterium]
MDIIQQASIDWASAHLACEAAMLQAQALSVHVSIAVVDRNGRTIAFLCDPLAPFHCSDIATDKAYTAASFGLPTHRWTEISQSMSVAVKEGLLQRDRMVMFGGGFPIVVDGERVGGIGVSGASETQDMECAVAALNKIGADKESV